MTPLVSICVPNLNARPFLKERFQSILDQSLPDWELLIYDSHSDDGSWDLIQDIAKKDGRIRAMQGPREGPYPAWNECLRNTSGKYVYVATSDDSMAPEFLERMVGALEMHRNCDVAHSPAIIVNDRSEAVKELTWPDPTAFGDGIRDLLTVPHIRRAPHDGLIQLTGRQAVLSITQLVIRRSLFSRIGMFPDRWGSVSDFNWEMKAGLTADTIYVPNTWATWRYHPTQATARVDFFSADHFRNVEEMIQDAVQTCESYLPPAVLRGLRGGMLDRSKELRTYYSVLRERRDSGVGKRLFQASQLFSGTRAVRREIRGRLLGKPKWTENATTEIRLWLESLGLQPLIRCSRAPASGDGSETSPMSPRPLKSDLSL